MLASSAKVVSTTTFTSGRSAADPPGGRHPVHVRHAQVHQDDVGAELEGAGDGLLAVGRLPDDDDAGDYVEHGGEGLPDGPLVVGDDYAQRTAAIGHGRAFAVTADRAGTRSVTSQPRPPGPAVSAPPSSRARSFRPSRPKPPPVAAMADGAWPGAGPASVTVSTTWSGSNRSRTTGFEPTACLAALVRPSWAVRWIASETSFGQRSWRADYLERAKAGHVHQLAEGVDDREGVLPEGADGAPGLGQPFDRKKAGPADQGPGLAQVGRVPAEQGVHRVKLEHERTEAVGEDVVDLLAALARSDSRTATACSPAARSTSAARISASSIRSEYCLIVVAARNPAMAASPSAISVAGCRRRASPGLRSGRRRRSPARQAKARAWRRPRAR